MTTYETYEQYLAREFGDIFLPNFVGMKVGDEAKIEINNAVFKRVALEKIGKLCHDLNRAICIANGDDSQKSWKEAESWQRRSTIAGVNHILKTIESGREPNPADQHEAWMADKISDGWVWGPEKCAEKKTHPCIAPYESLPNHQRLKDQIFIIAAKAMIDSYGSVF